MLPATINRSTVELISFQKNLKNIPNIMVGRANRRKFRSKTMALATKGTQLIDLGNEFQDRPTRVRQQSQTGGNAVAYKQNKGRDSSPKVGLGWGNYIIAGGVAVYEVDQAQSTIRTVWSGENVPSVGNDLINRGIDVIAGPDSTAGDVGGVVYDYAGAVGILRHPPKKPDEGVAVAALAVQTGRREWY
jgi:hypothetical protein